MRGWRSTARPAAVLGDGREGWRACRARARLHQQHLVSAVEHDTTDADEREGVARQRARAARQPRREHHILRRRVVEAKAGGHARRDDRRRLCRHAQPQPLLARRAPAAQRR
eukprot:894487-Prymnesium_polylepis.1